MSLNIDQINEYIINISSDIYFVAKILSKINFKTDTSSKNKIYHFNKNLNLSLSPQENFYTDSHGC